MAHFRRRPTPIDAVQLRWDTWDDVCKLIDAPGGLAEGNPEGCYVDQDGKETDDCNGRIGLKIPVGSIVQLAVQDDWIVRMPDGTIDSFKPAAFAALFESHAEYKVEYEPDWHHYPHLAVVAYADPELAKELRKLLSDARTDAVQYVHDVRAEELERARADERKRMRALLGEDDSRNVTAVTVRELTDADLLQALRNAGIYLEDCDACAEIFFTGSKTHEHTCPKGR